MSTVTGAADSMNDGGFIDIGPNQPATPQVARRSTAAPYDPARYRDWGARRVSPADDLDPSAIQWSARKQVLRESTAALSSEGQRLDALRAASFRMQAEVEVQSERLQQESDLLSRERARVEAQAKAIAVREAELEHAIVETRMEQQRAVEMRLRLEGAAERVREEEQVRVFGPRSDVQRLQVFDPSCLLLRRLCRGVRSCCRSGRNNSLKCLSGANVSFVKRNGSWSRTRRRFWPSQRPRTSPHSSWRRCSACPCTKLHSCENQLLLVLARQASGKLKAAEAKCRSDAARLEAAQNKLVLDQQLLDKASRKFEKVFRCIALMRSAIVTVCEMRQHKAKHEQELASRQSSFDTRVAEQTRALSERETVLENQRKTLERRDATLLTREESLLASVSVSCNLYSMTLCAWRRCTLQ